MLSEGQQAPTFELPAITPEGRTTLNLRESTADDRVVLLLFYPFDFSPVCTTELCALRDAEWFQFTPNLELWAASGDSTYAHRQFASKYDLQFPLLSDYNASTANKFNVRYDSWENHESVPKRAVFVIDRDRTIQYAWAAEDAYKKPDFVPIKAALDKLSTVDKTLVPDEVELEVEYET